MDSSVELCQYRFNGKGALCRGRPQILRERLTPGPAGSQTQPVVAAAIDHAIARPAYRAAVFRARNRLPLDRQNDLGKGAGILTAHARPRTAAGVPRVPGGRCALSTYNAYQRCRARQGPGR